MVVFALQVSFPAVFVLLLVIVHFGFNTVGLSLVILGCLLNADEVIWLEVYVSMTMAVLLPMGCYTLPHDKQTIWRSPHALYKRGPDTLLVVLSCGLS